MSQKLGAYIQRLEDQAKPATNDGRYSQYVKLENAYSSCLGNDQIYLVGSTTEGLKLRSKHQGGDADYIICSGKLKIPVESLEPREATPCYVQIKEDQLPADFRDNTVDGYLSADLVRQFNPKLFTTGRALFTINTTTADYIEGPAGGRVTTTGLPMKVGTARKRFRNLCIEGIDTSEFRSRCRRLTQTRRSQVAALLRKRWIGVQRENADSVLLRRVLNIITDQQVPGNGYHFGEFNNFAALLNSVLRRPPLDANEDQVPVIFNNDLDEEDVDVSDRKYKATYTEMTSKDFVPALKIAADRQLECVVVWYDRVKERKWPPRNLVQEICNTELFLVARDAPIKPDHLRDFCISFNMPEMKLSKCLTTVQRRVYLILKSYLNGVLKKKHEDLKIELKLKSYYLKTALFWVCENENPSFWTDEMKGVTKVLDFLLLCLSEKNLSHYFVVKSNLFAEMSAVDFDVLQECIKEIKKDPLSSIEEFFNEDAKVRAEIWLSEEEVRCIQQKRDDSGNQEAMDQIEDALIDLHRGCNESTRDLNGNAPIKEAVLKLLDTFFNDERANEAENATSNLSLGGARNIEPSASPRAFISGLIGNYITPGSQQQADRQRVSQVADLLHTLSQLSPEISQHVAKLGGRDGIESLVAHLGRGKEEQRQNMRAVTESYLSCAEEEAESVRMVLNQTYKGYFIGRRE